MASEQSESAISRRGWGFEGWGLRVEVKLVKFFNNLKVLLILHSYKDGP